MLALGRRMIPLATAGDDWNRDPLLLGVGNGVIELGCGKLRAGQPQDMINFFTDVAYDPVALCPRWQRFLLEVFQGDEELVDWIWRLIGYLLDRPDQRAMLLPSVWTRRERQEQLPERALCAPWPLRLQCTVCDF